MGPGKGRWVGKLQGKLTKGPMTSGETETQSRCLTRASWRVIWVELRARTTEAEVRSADGLGWVRPVPEHSATLSGVLGAGRRVGQGLARFLHKHPGLQQLLF